MAAARFHQKMIELGKESLTWVGPHLRDVTGITISSPTDMIPVLKREISHFRDCLLAMAHGSKSQDAVYQVNFQLFPLLKVKE